MNKQLGDRLNTILTSCTRKAREAALQTLQNMAVGPKCTSILLRHHQDLLKQTINMLINGRLLPQTRQEVLVLFANVVSSLSDGEDEQLYLKLQRKYLLPALVHEFNDHTPCLRKKGH